MIFLSWSTFLKIYDGFPKHFFPQLAVFIDLNDYYYVNMNYIGDSVIRITVS